MTTASKESVLYPATPPAEFFEDPYSFFKRLRETDPVHWSEQVGAWIMTRYDDISTIFSDPRFSSQRVPALMNQLPEDARREMTPLTEHLSNWLTWTTPPDHKRIRGLLNRTFAPRMVENMRPQIQGVVDRLLDAAQAKGGMEVIRDFAFPLPFTVICELFGLPEEYQEPFKRSADGLLGFFGTSRAQADRALIAQKAICEMRDCLTPLYDQRRRKPQSDLISYLVDIGKDQDRLNEVELLSVIVFFLFAGHETTTDLIGNGLLALLRNPDELQSLREDLSGRIDGAIEEMLRYDSPIQRLWRIATEDVPIDGKLIERGQIVMCMLGAANRDPAQFDQPDKFDIGRQNNRHLAFGQGVHYCIGAPLGRLEGKVAFTSLLNRFPSLKLTGPFSRKQNMSHRRLTCLPVAFG